MLLYLATMTAIALVYLMIFMAWGIIIYFSIQAIISLISWLKSKKIMEDKWKTLTFISNLPS